MIISARRWSACAAAVTGGQVRDLAELAAGSGRPGERSPRRGRRHAAGTRRHGRAGRLRLAWRRAVRQCGHPGTPAPGFRGTWPRPSRRSGPPAGPCAPPGGIRTLYTEVTAASTSATWSGRTKAPRRTPIFGLVDRPPPARSRPGGPPAEYVDERVHRPSGGRGYCAEQPLIAAAICGAGWRRRGSPKERPRGSGGSPRWRSMISLFSTRLTGERNISPAGVRARLRRGQADALQGLRDGGMSRSGSSQLERSAGFGHVGRAAREPALHVTVSPGAAVVIELAAVVPDPDCMKQRSLRFRAQARGLPAVDAGLRWR